MSSIVTILADRAARPTRQISGVACAACERHFIVNEVKEI